MKSRAAQPVARLASIVLLLIAGVTAESAVSKKKISLRVNDAIGEPGGVVAVVLRTYASRPLGQGQICLGTGKRAAQAEKAATIRPFVALEGFKVFGKGRVLADAELRDTEEGQACPGPPAPAPRSPRGSGGRQAVPPESRKVPSAPGSAARAR